jgi:leucyl-tRNA synthetase
VMADAGLVSFREPFSKLLNQGQLLGVDGFRMSKSRGNVITPDSTAETYGADALRLYVMFMAPFEQDVAWSTDGISGSRRFLNKVWSLIGENFEKSAEFKDIDPELLHLIHKTIRKVEDRIEGFRFNTMVSTLMEFVNSLNERRRSGNWKTHTFHQALEILILIIAPSAPHIADRLWMLTGHAGSVHSQRWPEWNKELAFDDSIQLPIQVDGKLRAVIEVSPDAAQKDIQEAALAVERIEELLAGSTIDRWIYVPGKVLNIVTRE